MHYSEYTLKDFTDVLSAATPTPGGGGASALCAAIGTSLGSMVAKLTEKNKNYADVSEDMRVFAQKAYELKVRFLSLIDEDAQAYEPLSYAYKLKRDTDEQKAARSAAIQASLLNACLVPLKIIETCAEAIDLLKLISDKGSKMVLCDTCAGLMMLRSSINTASLNVFINLKSMADKETAKKLKNKTTGLVSTYTKKADDIYNEVLKTIS